MLYRFSLAILAAFCLLGQGDALNEDVYSLNNETLHIVDVNDSQYVDNLISFDEDDMSYEEGLSEDDGVKMNYEMPPLHRQYKGSMDQYYKEFEM